MKKERETQEYLPPQEQLIIAAKIHRLHEATVETFNPEIHVVDAQDIVKALHPRIKPASKYSLRHYSNSSSTSQVRAGATSAGNVNASFKEQKTKKVELGIHEYRIGNYVATKVPVTKDLNCINFEEFWNRGFVNRAFNKVPEQTAIIYDATSLDILRISKLDPTIKQHRFKLWNRRYSLIRVHYRENPLWREKK